MEFRCLCLFIRYRELCGIVEFDSLAPSAWMGLRKPRLAMFVHKHWLLMITCTSEASCKSTFLPFLLEQPCSVLCDCCLPISGFLACGSLLVILLLAYWSTVCSVSCFINSILLLLLYSNVSISHKFLNTGKSSV